MTRIRATVYDGETFHEIPYGLGTGDWLRGLTTPVLERVAGGVTRCLDLDPRRLQRLARTELERRQPDHSRYIATAAGVGARRRWITLRPVITNYANGAH